MIYPRKVFENTWQWRAGCTRRALPSRSPLRGSRGASTRCCSPGTCWSTTPRPTTPTRSTSARPSTSWPASGGGTSGRRGWKYLVRILIGFKNKQFMELWRWVSYEWTLRSSLFLSFTHSLYYTFSLFYTFFFCSTSLPLASTRWVRMTSSSLCPQFLSRAVIESLQHRILLISEKFRELILTLSLSYTFSLLLILILMSLSHFFLFSWRLLLYSNWSKNTYTMELIALH